MVMQIKLFLLVVVVLLCCMSEAKKISRGGQGVQRFVGIRIQHGVSQLNLTRIAGRCGTPLRWGNPHVHIISPTVTPPIM